MSAFKTFASDRKGYAAVEFGIVGGLLVVFMLGIVDVGRMSIRSMQTKYAAEAGALYGQKTWNSGFSPEGIGAAVRNATTAGIVSASPVPETFCGCPTASGITQIAVCSGSDSSSGGTGDCDAIAACQPKTACGTGFAPATYIRVRTTAAFSPLFKATFINYPQSLNATAIVRAK